MVGRIVEFEDLMRQLNREHKRNQSNLEWFKKRIERATAA
jgi:hypothetical protein